MMERKMRRFKQQLTIEDTVKILQNGRECVMAVAGDDDYPYAVPVNYVYDGKKIYIHAAVAGHKIDAIKRNRKLSLCVIEKSDIAPEKFTTYFRSAIVFGTARLIETTDEKVEALRKLCEKYSPGLDPTAEIEKFIKTVAIIEITIDSLTGKQSIELTNQQ